MDPEKTPQKSNELKIGDLYLTSNEVTIYDLVAVAEIILEKKSTKDYLDQLKRNNLKRGESMFR